MSGSHRKALAVAQQYFAAFEARDPDGVAALLTHDASNVIRLHIDGSPRPWYVFEGREHVKAYIGSVAAKFDRVAFVNKEWTVAEDAGSVFLQADGDILSTAEQLAYQNVYLFKVELRGEKIARVIEYANPVTYANLGIENSESEQAAQGA